MIDFHSHILPGIDDGSKDCEMSLQMIRALSEQGVDTIAATSHFYATQQSPLRFLERRQHAFERLIEVLPADSPQILLGAEVLYFPGFSHIQELPRLFLQGTDILLLEMPFETWTDYMIREVNEIARSGSCRILLAHIERYYFQQRRDVWDSFLDNGVMMQSNADFFLPFRTRQKALHLLKDGRIHVLGSDCHNITTRPPRLSEAYNIIHRRFGQAALDEIDALGRYLLTGEL